MLYFIFGIVAGFLAVLMSIAMRMQLAHPSHTFLSGDYQHYNVMVTMHGILMLFFVIMPITLGGFGNFFVSAALCSDGHSHVVVTRFFNWGCGLVVGLEVQPRQCVFAGLDVGCGLGSG